MAEATVQRAGKKSSLILSQKSVQVELEQTYPRLGTIYSLCSVYYPNIR